LAHLSDLREATLCLRIKKMRYCFKDLRILTSITDGIL
jgi:hypothetical protein